MSTLTAKLGLTKPDPTENVDVAIINSNYDKIDAAFSNFLTGAFKNAIRNGDMGVTQRGRNTFTTGYTADGWEVGSSGGAVSVTPAAAGVSTDMGVDGAVGQLPVATSGQAAVGDFSLLLHKIENVRKFAGKQVTLSFIAKANAGTPKIGLELTQSFGSGGAPSANVETTISAVTISAVATRYSVTFTVPSIVGKTIGTTDEGWLGIRLWLSAGANFAARASNIGIQNATITITDVQLELGAVATAFERLPVAAQLAWCQRYFFRYDCVLTGENLAVGFEAGTTALQALVRYPTFMRAVPTVTTGGDLRINDGVVDVAVTGTSIVSNTVHSVTINFNTAGSLAGGRAGAVRHGGGAQPFITGTAEL